MRSTFRLLYLRPGRLYAAYRLSGLIAEAIDRLVADAIKDQEA